MGAINEAVIDEVRQRELLQEDEDEDFMDETTVNPDGTRCPAALKLVACMLLFEITAFMRETYKTVAKSTRGTRTSQRDTNHLSTVVGPGQVRIYLI